MLKEKTPLSPNNNSEYQSTSELKEKSAPSPNNNSDDASVSNPEKTSSDVNNCESHQQEKDMILKGDFSPRFKSCMIRIPGSYNSKCLDSSTQIKIIQKWDGRYVSTVNWDYLP